MMDTPQEVSAGPYEIRATFTSFREFTDWCQEHPEIFGKPLLDGALQQIRKAGFTDVLSGETVSPDRISISENLRESLLYRGLNSRIRGVLLELLATQAEMALGDNQIRIYAPEALTALALLLRGRYPFFLGSEYLPTREQQDQYLPILHQDLQALTFPADAFHVVLCNEVFEHVPLLDRALKEIFRVLKPGGRLIATFPFAFTCEHSIVKAKLSENGAIEHLMEPEYHGDPVAPEKGALVYQIPGWDILQRTRDAGFGGVEIRLLVSARHGVLAEGINGILIMMAGK